MCLYSYSAGLTLNSQKSINVWFLHFKLKANKAKLIHKKTEFCSTTKIKKN